LLRSACLIGGEWVQADSINVENPATALSSAQYRTWVL
jgi:hypothetical protein